MVPRSDALPARAVAVHADAAVAAASSARPLAAADVGIAAALSTLVIAARDALIYVSTCGVGVIADEFDNGVDQGDEGCVTPR